MFYLLFPMPPDVGRERSQDRSSALLVAQVPSQCLALKVEEENKKHAEEVEEGTEDLICDHYLVCQEKFDRVSKF